MTEDDRLLTALGYWLKAPNSNEQLKMTLSHGSLLFQHLAMESNALIFFTVW